MSQGKSKTFNVNSSTNDQNINVEWLVDDDSQKTDQNVTSSSYEFKGDSTGELYPQGSYQRSQWRLRFIDKNMDCERRIHRQFKRKQDLGRTGMPTTYTWDAQSYSGFYYDLDSGVSSEEMTITDIGRSIDSGNIEYVTRPTETKFEYNNWGSYQIIGFMAEKYFAGYSKQNSTVIGDDVSPISDGILSKILIDSDDKKSASSGDSLALEEGYSLNIKEVDVNGNSVWVQLEKDGKVVDDGFVSSGEDYVYKTDLGKATDVPTNYCSFRHSFFRK